MRLPPPCPATWPPVDLLPKEKKYVYLNFIKGYLSIQLTLHFDFFIVKKQRYDFLGFECVRLEVAAADYHALYLKEVHELGTQNAENPKRATRQEMERNTLRRVAPQSLPRSSVASASSAA